MYCTLLLGIESIDDDLSCTPETAATLARAYHTGKW